MSPPRRATAVLAAAALALATAATGAAARDSTSAGAAGTATGAEPRLRNVILLIGDGMGFAHIEAADFFQHGAAGTQAYASFPYRAALSTHPAGDPNPTDSAAAATALATGVKTVRGAIGMGPDGTPLVGVVQVAEAAGKATGVVSSVPFSHATPAGFVAHSPRRGDLAAIAHEMIQASAVDVIMGAGHPWFDDSGHPRTAPAYQHVGSAATWDALAAGTAGGDADGDGDRDPWLLIQTRAAFQALARGPAPARVIGVPQVATTLQQARAGATDTTPYAAPLTATVPTLAEMTAAALNVLDADPDGFLLVVEGGAIDWAAHAGQSGRMIEEQLDFNRAVEAALDWVARNSSWAETLVIVTSDHETGDLTGPGTDSARAPLVNAGKGALPGMVWRGTHHTSRLVPFFAKGDAASLFRREESGVDPVRGPFLDNTAVGRVLKAVLR